MRSEIDRRDLGGRKKGRRRPSKVPAAAERCREAEGPFPPHVRPEDEGGTRDCERFKQGFEERGGAFEKVKAERETQTTVYRLHPPNSVVCGKFTKVQMT